MSTPNLKYKYTILNNLYNKGYQIVVSNEQLKKNGAIKKHNKVLYFLKNNKTVKCTTVELLYSEDGERFAVYTL